MKRIYLVVRTSNDVFVKPTYALLRRECTDILRLIIRSFFVKLAPELNNAVFIFLRCQTESICERKHIAKFLLPRTAGWHRNVLGSFIMEIIAYKGHRPFSVFVDGFVSHFALLQLYSNYLVLSFSKYRGRIE